MRRNFTNYTTAAAIALALIATSWSWKRANTASTKTSLLLEEIDRQAERIAKDDSFKIRKSNSDDSIFAGQPIEDYLSKNKPAETHAIERYSVYGPVFTPSVGWPLVICRDGRVVRCQSNSCFGVYIDFDILTRDEGIAFEQALEAYRKLNGRKESLKP